MSGAGGAASGAASSAASSAPKTSAPQTSTPQSSAPQTSAPQSSAPSTSSTQVSTQSSAPSANTGSIQQANYQAETTGYAPSSEVSTGSSSLPSNMQTEAGNAKPLERMDADELQTAGVDTSEGGLDLPDQQQTQISTPEGVTPDADELTVEQLEDPEIANSNKDVDQLQELQDEEAAEAEAAAEEEPQPGDKVDDGKVVDENGQVKDSPVKESGIAAGRAVLAFYSKGESLKYDQQVLSNPAVDKTLGVVSDVAENTVPGLKETAEELSDLNAPELVNNALNTVGSAMNKDYAKTAENALKTKASLNKSKEAIKKKIVGWLLAAATYFLIFIFFFICIVGPIIGGVMYLTDKVVDLYNAISDGLSDVWDDLNYGTLEYINYQTILDGIPDYNKLPAKRKEVINIALSALGGKYLWGGKPTGPGLSGLPKSGVDCSGFVNWVYWTATGENPNMGGTEAMVNRPTSKMIPISITELKAGDIVVHNTNGAGHVGIYAGDGDFIHAAGKDYGIVKGKSGSLTKSSNNLRFYRYAGIDD